MNSATTKIKKMNIVFSKGKPTDVIIGIKDFKDLLERAEDLEDINELERLRKGAMSFRTLDEFLSEN